MPSSISYDWEKTLSKDELPKFETLIEFIYSAASRFSSRLNTDIPKDTSSYPNKRMKFNNHDQRSKGKGTGETFLTSTSEVCTLCSESSHPLFRCKKFRDSTVTQRIQIVKDEKLCNNCLRSHPKNECKLGNCMVCKGKHNTLLHVNPKVAENQNRTKS